MQRIFLPSGAAGKLIEAEGMYPHPSPARQSRLPHILYIGGTPIRSSILVSAKMLPEGSPISQIAGPILYTRFFSAKSQFSSFSMKALI